MGGCVCGNTPLFGFFVFFFTCPQFPESIISIFSWRWGRQGWRPGAHLWPLLRVCLHRDGVCTFVSFESCKLLISGSLLFVYYLLNCHTHKVGAASMFIGLRQKCECSPKSSVADSNYGNIHPPTVLPPIKRRRFAPAAESVCGFSHPQPHA